MKKLILIIALIALFTTGCTENTKDVAEDKNTSTEQSNSDAVIAPDFQLEGLDGSIIKLSEMRDKNVILNFWFANCGWCVIEMPDLQKLQDTHKDDLLVLTVNVGDSKEVVEKFMEENNLSLTVALDNQMKVANTYGVRSYPTTIAVNKKGEAIKGYVGMLTYEQMEQIYSYFEE